MPHKNAADKKLLRTWNGYMYVVPSDPLYLDSDLIMTCLADSFSWYLFDGWPVEKPLSTSFWYELHVMIRARDQEADWIGPDIADDMCTTGDGDDGDH